jgi:hypothetical protein
MNLLLLQASFVGAIAITDLVKSTLGPKGMVRTCSCAQQHAHIQQQRSAGNTNISNGRRRCLCKQYVNFQQLEQTTAASVNQQVLQVLQLSSLSTP